MPMKKLIILLLSVIFVNSMTYAYAITQGNSIDHNELKLTDKSTSVEEGTVSQISLNQQIEAGITEINKDKRS